jgi:hypothetical protein
LQLAQKRNSSFKQLSCSNTVIPKILRLGSVASTERNRRLGRPGADLQRCGFKS